MKLVILILIVAFCNAAHQQTYNDLTRRAVRKRQLRSKGKGIISSTSSKGKGSKGKGSGVSCKSTKAPGKGKGSRSSKSLKQVKGKGKGSYNSKSPKGKGCSAFASTLAPAPNQAPAPNPAPSPTFVVIGCEDVDLLPCDDTKRRSCEIRTVASNLSPTGFPNQQALNWILNVDTATNSCNNGAVRIRQRYILAAFFYSTSGQTWKAKEGWLSPEDECKAWRGISCVNGEVTKIMLESNLLGNIIPEELSGLEYLEELKLYDNLIESLPSNIGSYKSLKILDVEKNRLFGELFTSGFENLAGTLEYLLASDQPIGLRGQIPSYIENFTNLKELALSKNQFTGTIPNGITSLINLESLYLWDNDLSGSIPQDIGKLTNLVDLNLSKNQKMTGTIPSSISQLVNLVTLILDDVNLTGGIAALEGLDSLKTLRMANNTLSGQLNVLTSFSNLVHIDFENNSLTGSLPDFSNNISLEIIDISSNELGGVLPVWLFNLSSIRSIFLNNNMITGSIPANFGGNLSLEQLWLHNNRLSGVIPGITQLVLPAVREIRLEYNDLTGSILNTSQMCKRVNDKILKTLRTDCSGGATAEVVCQCCTMCFP